MRRWVFAAALVVAVGVLAARVNAKLPAGEECAGIPKCIAITGPWVAVPTHGEADYLLQCTSGAVGGTDALASSQDIHATFDGITGSPVGVGRTTSRNAFFRAVSGAHRIGTFEPLIGCIPAPSSSAVTTGVKATPIGPPLDFAAKTVTLAPGATKSATIVCPNGEHLVDSWNATAFRTTLPPNPAFASAIRVRGTTKGNGASVAVSVSESLPQGVRAEVQVGVRCASE